MAGSSPSSQGPRFQGCQRQLQELLLGLFLLSQVLGNPSHASAGAGVEAFQHRDHLLAHPVAAEARVEVAEIEPDW